MMMTTSISTIGLQGSSCFQYHDDKKNLLFNVSCVFNKLRTTTTICCPQPPKYGPLMDQYTWMNYVMNFITWMILNSLNENHNVDGINMYG
jgi:hypothetical protein